MAVENLLGGGLKALDGLQGTESEVETDRQFAWNDVDARSSVNGGDLKGGGLKMLGAFIPSATTKFGQSGREAMDRVIR